MRSSNKLDISCALMAAAAPELWIPRAPIAPPVRDDAEENARASLQVTEARGTAPRVGASCSDWALRALRAWARKNCPAARRIIVITPEGGATTYSVFEEVRARVLNLPARRPPPKRDGDAAR
jgi:hypothetical protein